MPFIQPYSSDHHGPPVSPDDVTPDTVASHLSPSNICNLKSNHFDTYVTLSRQKTRKIKKPYVIPVPTAVLVT
jgi:hypothetical protein